MEGEENFGVEMGPSVIRPDENIGEVGYEAGFSPEQARKEAQALSDLNGAIVRNVAENDELYNEVVKAAGMQ
jgi:hypothetical protein